MKTTLAVRTLVSAVTLLALASCQNTSFYSVLGNKAQIQALAISPSSTTVPPNGTIQFSATGGAQPYTFSILSGVGTIDAATGLYTAPATPATTYVLVTDKDGATAKATVTNVDYWVTAISDTSASHVSGSAISGTFTVTNKGTAPGMQNFSWSVYVSTTATLGSGGTVIDTNTAAPLAAGATTSPAISFAGTWPTTPGTYYLIVTVSAPDALADPNNTMATGAIVISPASVNYVASVVTITSATSAAPGSTMAGKFTLTNTGANNGTQFVTWQAYASTTPTITGSSVLLDSGTQAPLAAGGFTTITLAPTCTWPLAYGIYYLVVRSSVLVDVNASNNAPFASASTATIGIYATIEANDTPAQANNFGVTLQPGMSIKVTGSLTTGDLNDFIAFGAGTANNVTFNLTWPSTGLTQTVTLWVYNASQTQLQGLQTVDNTFLIMPWTVGANAGTTCYISPQLTGTPGTGTYTLIITAN